MINTSAKKNCCGCGNCEKVCKFNAIKMLEDEDGFFYPYIDINKCVGCKQCQEICPIISENINKKYMQRAYAYKIKDNKSRLVSQSGGVFYCIAKHILGKNGVVYGVVLSRDLKAEYARITDEKELVRVAGSKYVQADINNIISDLEKDVLEGRECVFCGTPCYVDAVKQYCLKTKLNTEKLFLIDILCHGVPSPKLLRDYINYKNKITNRNIIDIKFRDKKVGGWGNYYSTLSIDNGKKIFTNEYMEIYRTDVFLRPSCYNCKYAKRERCSDLTLGDYWNIGDYYVGMVDALGVSCVIENSEKGKRILSQISEYCTIREMSNDSIRQDTLEKPVSRSQNLVEIKKVYISDGMEALINKINGKSVMVWKGFPITKDISFIIMYYVSKIKMTRLWISIKKLLKD